MKSNRILYVLLAVALAGNFWHFSSAAPEPRRPNNFNSNTITSPPSDAEAVDLSTTDWAPSQGSANARQIYVTGAGDVKVTYTDGGVVTYTLPANTSKSMLITRIWKTGTTATGIVAEY
jgi:hypothetical protein